MPEFPEPVTMMEALGIKDIVLEKDCVKMTMPVAGATRQPFGLLHGGASVALAETAASIGTWLNVDQATQVCVGLEINANHLRPKRDGIVTATAVPVHKGRTTMVWDIRIHDEAQKLVCISRCTVAIIDKPSETSVAKTPGAEASRVGTPRMDTSAMETSAIETSLVVEKDKH